MKTFGPACESSIDEGRILTQMERVRNHMLASAILNHWETLDEICKALEAQYPGCHFPQSSISAQLRHLRKPKFDSYRVEKRPRGDRSHGLFEYRIFPPATWEAGQQDLFARAS